MDTPFNPFMAIHTVVVIVVLVGRRISLKDCFIVYRHWCEENEMVFVSHEVPFSATSDRRSREAKNGTKCEVKTVELSSPTSGGEQ